MSDVLSDFSKSAIVKAIENNLYDAHIAWARAAGGEIHEDNEMCWICTEIPYAYFNPIAKIHLRSENADKRITEILTLFKSKDIPMEWWIGPSTQPSDLGKYLEKHGLKEAEDEPTMAIKLDSVDEGALKSSKLAIVRIEDLETLKQWVRTAAIAIYLPSVFEKVLYELSAGIGFDASAKYFIGFDNEEPVALCMLYSSSGVAGLYWLGTVLKARGKGFETAIAVRALREARNEGYKIGVLLTPDQGVKDLERIGFKEFCRFQFYL